MMLTFDPVPHEYRWRGDIVPSCTQVINSALGDAFADVPADRLEYARIRGKAIHRACELDTRAELDESTVVDEIRPYIDAWRSFRSSFQFSVIASERPLYSKVYGYAVTPDIMATVDQSFAVIEIKSGFAGLRAQLQTAAQAQAMHEWYETQKLPIRRFAIKLQWNGRPALVEHEAHAADWRDFLSCLNVHRLKQREAA